MGLGLGLGSVVGGGGVGWDGMGWGGVELKIIFDQYYKFTPGTDIMICQYPQPIPGANIGSH